MQDTMSSFSVRGFNLIGLTPSSKVCDPFFLVPRNKITPSPFLCWTSPRLLQIFHADLSATPWAGASFFNSLRQGNHELSSTGPPKNHEIFNTGPPKNFLGFLWSPQPPSPHVASSSSSHNSPHLCDSESPTTLSGFSYWPVSSHPPSFCPSSSPASSPKVILTYPIQDLVQYLRTFPADLIRDKFDPIFKSRRSFLFVDQTLPSLPGSQAQQRRFSDRSDAALRHPGLAWAWTDPLGWPGLLWARGGLTRTLS